MYLKISLLLGALPLLIHQCVAVTLPLQERDHITAQLEERQDGKTYWIHPSCLVEQLGSGQLRQAIKEAIWTAGRISESLHAFDGQLSDPGKTPIF